MFIKHESVEALDFDNLKITDYTAGKDTSSSIAEITVLPGIKHKVSRSGRSDKYYYVVKGKVNFTVNDESMDLAEGDVCIIKKGEWFTYSNNTSTEAKIILVHTPDFNLEFEEFKD